MSTEYLDWTLEAIPELAGVTNGTAVTTLYSNITGDWTAQQTGPTITTIPIDIRGSALTATGSTLARAGGYSAWGAPTSGTQTFNTRLGYRGETTHDTNIHLRAPDYQPTLGAFTSVDPLDGVDGSSTVANAYHYSNNDPLNLIDPEGTRALRGLVRPIRSAAGRQIDVTPTWVPVATTAPAPARTGSPDLLDDRPQPVHPPQTPGWIERGAAAALLAALICMESDYCPQSSGGTTSTTRQDYSVRLQAQGGTGKEQAEESVPITQSTPVTVRQGLEGIDLLKAKLSKDQLKPREPLFARAERYIASGPANGGLAYPGRSFSQQTGSIRVDVEIWRGVNFLS